MHGIPGFIVYDQDSVFLYDENIGDYRMTDVFDSYVKPRPFKPVFCRRADPESKGKIENVVKYVKQNFLLNRSYSNIDNLNKDAESWLNRTGNAMVHNTTCKVPYDVWCTECKDLQPYVPVTSSKLEKGHKILSTNKLRYIRDQLTVMLNCLAKYTLQDCDKALDLCLSKGLFSATDFKSILSQVTPIIEINEEVEIKPLGTPQTRLMVNIKPNRSDIDVYQNLFKTN